MPIQIPTVESCPIALRSRGLIEIEPELLGVLAGAVRDEDNEWLCILMGEIISKDGLHVIVDDIYIPPDQYRTHATCRVSKDENSLESLPEWVTNRLVGVLHSHHRMGAHFSTGLGGDKGPDGVNNTFPMSIVISSNYDNSEEYILLGFSYEAEIKFDLPCGSLGMCKAHIIPKGDKDWPSEWIIVRPITTGVHRNLGDCDNYGPSSDSTKYLIRREAICGVEELEHKPRQGAVFGLNGEAITKKLPEPTQWTSTSTIFKDKRSWWRWPSQEENDNISKRWPESLHDKDYITVKD